MLSKSLFSSSSTEWETPDDLFNLLNNEFNFTLDVCATPANAKCARYFTPEQNGLAQSWAGETCWCNPPYGRQIGLWVAKAHSESKRGATIVMLLPARTDTAWWHDHVMRSSEIRFIRGRLRFGGAKHGAPFPSCVVVFDGIRDIPEVSALHVHRATQPTQPTQPAQRLSRAALQAVFSVKSAHIRLEDCLRSDIDPRLLERVITDLHSAVHKAGCELLSLSLYKTAKCPRLV